VLPVRQVPFFPKCHCQTTCNVYKEKQSCKFKQIGEAVFYKNMLHTMMTITHIESSFGLG
jgi:hypothetical protein